MRKIKIPRLVSHRLSLKMEDECLFVPLFIHKIYPTLRSKGKGNDTNRKFLLDACKTIASFQKAKTSLSRRLSLDSRRGNARFRCSSLQNTSQLWEKVGKRIDKTIFKIRKTVTKQSFSLLNRRNESPCIFSKFHSIIVR